MDEHNETKIVPCEYCGRGDVEGAHFDVPCPHEPDQDRLEQNEPALCADIDKGRRYDRMVLELSQLAGDETRSRLSVEHHLNTAVRLLGVIQDIHYGKNNTDSPTWVSTMNTFLALDAIKAILKAQEADDA